MCIHAKAHSSNKMEDKERTREREMRSDEMACIVECGGSLRAAFLVIQNKQ